MRWITKNGVHILVEGDDSLESAIAEHYSYTDYSTVLLDRKEYGHIMHEINTWYKKDYKSKEILSKAIGDYVYTFENYEYNEYRFIGRDKIETDILDMIDEELSKYDK